MNIKCRFCERNTDVSEYDFARWSRGELVYCESCSTDFKNNRTKRRISSG